MEKNIINICIYKHIVNFLIVENFKFGEFAVHELQRKYFWKILKESNIKCLEGTLSPQFGLLIVLQFFLRN